jgi:hypothetical protein
MKGNKTANLTENKLRGIISESVRQALNELDWKTYASAGDEAQRRSMEGPETYDNLGDRIRYKMKYANRASGLHNAATSRFNQDFGYNDGNNQVKMGGDFDSTEEFAPHAKGLKSKGYGNPMSYEHGWNNHKLTHQTPQEFFDNDDAANAYSRADDELRNYRRGNYSYNDGKWESK